MWTKTAAIVAALTCLAATPAGAQNNEYRQQLDQQLQTNRSQLQQEGYAVAAGPFTGALSAGGKERFTLPVENGVSYKVVGVCDNDCTNVDLRVFNLNGQNIGEDVLDDDVPIVDLQPTGTGRGLVVARSI